MSQELHGLEIPEALTARFHLRRVLNAGEYAIVWLADQVVLERPVALKLLRIELDPNCDERGRFLDEARITASLRHPNVVVIYDHGIEEDVPWIAYEYVPGGSLSFRMAQGALPWREAVEVTVQIASALALAHDHGILHRDVKPGNVFQSTPGFFKLGDFGLAKWTTMPSRTKTGGIVGTPAYLAPEVIEGLQATPASDIYALGALFFELVTGVRPFVTTKEATVLAQHLMTPPPIPSGLVPGLPTALDSVVQTAMAKNPKDRYSTAEEMRRVLTSLSSGPTGSSWKPSRRAKESDPARPGGAASSVSRARWPFSVVGFSVIAAVTITVVWMIRAPAPLDPGLGDRRGRASPYTLTLLSVTPQPPRSALVEYSLRPTPSMLQYLETRASGKVISRTPVEGARGKATLQGLASGQTYEIGLAGGPRVGTFRMPHVLPLWVDLLASDTAVTVHVRSVEPMALDVRIVRSADRKELFAALKKGSHHFHQVVGGLTHETQYVLRLRLSDPRLYIPPKWSEWTFQTENRWYIEMLRREIPSWLSSSPVDRGPELTEPYPFPLTIPDSDAVSLALKTADDPQMSALLNMWIASGDPRAGRILARAVEVAPTPDERLRIASLLVKSHEPDSFARITAQSVRNRFPLSLQAARAYATLLITCDPIRALSHFRAVGDRPSSAPLLDRLALAPALGQTGASDLIPTTVALALVDPVRSGVPTAEGLAAAGGEDARRGLCRLLDALRGPSSPQDALAAALAALGRIGQPDDVASVLAHVRSPVPLIRVRVAQALGQIGGLPASDVLIGLLSDSDPHVRRASACGLGRLKVRKALASLIAHLGDAPGSAGRVPRALGLIGDPSAGVHLLDLARREPATNDVFARLDRAEALWALGILRVSAARPVLERALARGSFYECYRAAEALGCLGDRQARPVLEACRKRSGNGPILTEALDRALRVLREGREPRGRRVVVDASSGYERTGVVLEAGEDVRVEVGGLLIQDCRTLRGVPEESGTLKSARTVLTGRTNQWDSCSPGKGEIDNCTRCGRGELVLSLGSTKDSPFAAGFASVWIEGGVESSPGHDSSPKPLDPR